MKSVISKSVLLGVALAAISGCSTSGDKGGSESNLGNVGLAVQIANSDGLTLSSIGYSFVGSGTKSYSGNITSPQKSKTISGRVGNVDPGTYNITLTGHPDDHSEIDCTGKVNGISVVAGKAAKANVSVVCTQHVVGQDAGPATSGMIDVSGDATLVKQVDGVCPIFWNDSASALEIPADGTTTVALTGAASPVTPVATLAWSATSGTVDNHADGAATFTCAKSATDSTVTVTLSISTTLTQCGAPVTDSFDIKCSGVGGGGGGATSTGGTTSTGGNATGGNATGGNATGGNATGGNATGGNATGGNATGGTSPTNTDPIGAILTAYVSGQPSADECTPACATGCKQFESTNATFLSLLSCIMPTGGYQVNGSCYDYAGTNTAVSCYCGLTDTSTCTTTGGIGTCAAQETAAGMTPGTVLTGFTDVTTQAGKANAYVNCLSTTCGCFW
jgi:hypothetical protein